MGRDRRRQTVPETPRQRELRERRALILARADRVERLNLRACRICGGAAAPVADVSLRCDCRERSAKLEARVNGIRYRHAGEVPSLADILAP